MSSIQRIYDELLESMESVAAKQEKLRKEKKLCMLETGMMLAYLRALLLLRKEKAKVNDE